MRIKGESGQFERLGDERREVRSIRLTDAAWAMLGSIASQRGITRADLLEMMVQDDFLSGYLTPGGQTLEEVGELVVKDPAITRNGKDSGSVRRAVAAFIERLR